MRRGIGLIHLLLILAGIVALAAIVAVSIARSRQEKGVAVNAEAASTADISRLVKASGEINPKEKVNISAHVIGKIERLYVEEGDWIRAGQPFLELEKQAFVAARDDWRARLRQAETAVQQAEVDLADARLKEGRAERLNAEGIVPHEQLEAAKLTETSAQLRLDQARDAVEQTRANLEKAEDDLEKTTIFAPISGKVISLSAEAGEVVVTGTMNNPASVIGTIADLSEILAEVDVDETEIVYVKVGQEADLNVDAVPDHPYHGKVVEVGSSGYTRPQQQDVTFFRVKVLLDDPDAALRPGMSVRASINTATHPGVTVVPIQAVVERPPLPTADKEVEPAADKAVKPEKDSAAKPAPAASSGAPAADEIPVVFVVADDKVHQRPVETGISDTTRVEVTRGLEAGERVVVGPYRTLRDLKDGDAVHVEEKNTKAPPGGAATGSD